MFPWYSITMLGFESSSVITKRLAKVGRGGAQASEEIQLMCVEKAQAAFEAGTALMFGGTISEMIDRLRSHVAANEARLSA